MKKIKFSLMFLATILLLSSCTSTKKVINNRPQTFTEFVILNKYSKEYRAQQGMSQEVTWDNLTSDSFPGLRLQKWLKSEEVVHNEQNN
ncbi:MAG: hypothetical protein ACRCX8_16740 [Sarcina sp.]